MKAIKTYWLPVLLIICWWCAAFHHATKESAPSIATTPPPSHLNVSEVSLIKREHLKEALAGDSDLMMTLIADWDIEAQMLQKLGTGNYARLSAEDFLRSQILGRHLRLTKNLSSGSLHEPSDLDRYLRSTESHATDRKFLPQTVASASLLLALAETREIIALPEVLRNQSELFPPSITNQIPLSIDRHNSEKLFLLSPTVAFVANYSQPTTIQALKNQGVILHTMGDLCSIVAISKEIVKIGAIINRPQKAELLTLFIEAAMCAIDNQVRLLTQRLEESHQEIPRVLCLNHYQNFSVPSPSSLTGQLLERIALFDITLPYASQKAPGDNWVVPIGQEQIVNLNPDCILIITENKQAIEEEIFTESSLKDVMAVKNKKIFFLDDAIQMSPSQYVVLAYQDLVEALARLL